MSEILIGFSNSDEKGWISCTHKNDKKYYNTIKCKMLIDSVGCADSIAEMRHRYINWSDITGFIPFRSSTLSDICHKRPKSGRWYCIPPGFDHTLEWGRKGDKFPSFCLTEPYGIEDGTYGSRPTFEQLRNEWIKEGYNLQFKVFPKSEKSLWVPNKTFMVFWWCPDYFDFDAHEDLLFSHEDASEFSKKCTKILSPINPTYKKRKYERK